MPSITSAGVASGIDFESIISASLEAKKVQMGRNLTIRKEENNIEISGVGKLKSALETFQKSLEGFTKGTAFNARKITTDMPESGGAFTVTAKDDATNMYHDIAVTQLATSEKLNTTIAADKKFGAGKITIGTGVLDADGKEKTFTVDVEQDESIDSIRRKINDNDFGVTANIVKTASGVQLTFDGGTTGQDQGKLSIKAEGDQSLVDTFDSTKMNRTAGQDAKVLVDGHEITSHSNVFEDQVSGITITANKVSEKDDKTGQFKTNKVELTEDTEAVTKKMQEFVDSYNTLQKTLNDLYKHNTYDKKTGKNNYDGGELAGDSMVKSLQQTLSNTISSYGADNAKNELSIFNMGIEFGKDGTLSLDTDKFKEALKDNYNTVVNAFSGKDSFINKFDTLVKDYTKSGGILAEREDRLNTENSNIAKKEADNVEFLEKYEASLRAKYAGLDSLIAGYNSSMTYINQIMMQSMQM